MLDACLFHSSLGCPFLVYSDRQLVVAVPAPGKDEFERLREVVTAYVDGCAVRGVIMVADFEGEMPGHGGVLTTAQFQLTFAVDVSTLEPHAQPSGPSRTLGLNQGLRPAEPHLLLFQFTIDISLCHSL